MATEVAVIIPWAGSCPHRRRARAWVRSWYARHFGSWTTVVATAAPGPWCKAAAVIPAIEATRAELIVLSDADVICRSVGLAVEAVREGASWAVPHDRVLRLDQGATEQLIAIGTPGTTYTERPYEPMVGGGLLVAPRELLLEVPLDPRFVGWGQEDESHAYALRCLAGEPWRGRGDLVHLWHPPQDRQSRRIGSDESWALRRRYRRARNDQAAMRELLQEARDAE